MAPLPPPSGPFVLGVSDLEVDNLLLRLYYPTRLSPPPSPAEPKPSWLIQAAYGRGYGTFMKIPSFISLPVFYSLFGGVTIPHAVTDAPIMGSQNKDPTSSEGSSESPEPTFPVLLFSHGLGGMRTTYSNICYNIASHGFVVAAVEHRDKSASLTFRNNQEEIQYERLPTNADEHEFRNSQLKIRTKEFLDVYHLLKELNEGKEVKNLLPSQFDISGLKGRLQMGNVVVAGHSFGGASAIQSSHYYPDLFKGAISLDGWMFPLNHELHEQPPETPLPLLFVNMELFQWEKNVTKMTALVERTNAKHKELGIPHKSHLITIKGAQHQNQSDFALLLPTFRGRKIGMLGPIDPLRCLELNNRICLKFLQGIVPFPSETVAKDDILDPEKQPEIRFDI